MNEKREFKRLKASLPCRVRWEDRILVGRVADLSMGGALVADLSDAPPPDGTVATLTFHAQDEELSVLGSASSKVVRTVLGTEGKSGGSMGVQFDDQPETIRTKLRATLYVSAAEPD